MPFVELNQSLALEIFPGFNGHIVHSANMTFAHWTIKTGATLPEHAHVHEQVVNMIEGEFELTIAGKTKRLSRGSVAIIPSNALHSGKAITDCRIIDAFYPMRCDWCSAHSRAPTIWNALGHTRAGTFPLCTARSTAITSGADEHLRRTGVAGFDRGLHRSNGVREAHDQSADTLLRLRSHR